MRGRSLKRQALTRPNLTYLRWRFLRNANRTYRAWRARKDLSASAARVAEQIQEQGIVIGPGTQFLSNAGRNVLAEASDLVLQLSRSQEVVTAITNKATKNGKDYIIRLVPWEQEHCPDSPLIRLALDRVLLETVGAYLGMWPRLHAVGAWLNFPTQNEAKESQLWHRDPEDIKTVKVFIYLSDVSEETGPFCYIPRTHPFGSGAAIIPEHKHKKRILDGEMISAFPVGAWLTCTGPANTMIIADTVGFHRGGKPTRGNRILITFTYTSGTPLVKRVLHIAGRPSWITHPIQSCAL